MLRIRVTRSSFLLPFLFSCGGLAEVDETSSGIVGGAATTIATHPWQISLGDRDGHFCGGSIVAPQWILTAHHCIDGATASSLFVSAGITKLSQASAGQRRAVDRIVPYPGYVTPEEGKDVALLHLTTPLDLSGPNAKAIRLVTAAEAPTLTKAGLRAIVSGWGQTDPFVPTLPDNLMHVSVPIVANSVASTAYAMTITSDQLAAGATGRDSCQGDSGGPLTVLDAAGTGRLLAGVVSWGQGCGEAGFPGLYARASSFQTWVQSQIAPVTSTGSCKLVTGKATGLPLSIPDANLTGLRSTASVVATGDISSVKLSLDIAHPYRSDLVVTLMAPNNKRVVVWNRAGADGDNIVLTDFVVRGLAGPANGRWTLIVQDMDAGDVGALRSWSVTVNACVSP